MSLATVINDILDERFKSLHVAFLAKVLSLNSDRTKAKIQPLGLTREYGGKEKKQSVITGVHIAQSAKYKLDTESIVYVTSVGFDSETVNRQQKTILKETPIAKGDIVLCVCCDRNIDEALKGKNVLPPVGCHKQSDCVIVAII